MWPISPSGSLITGNGVGREVYVTDKNVGAGEITLSQQLYDPTATQNYTFTRFKYALDFSGFEQAVEVHHHGCGDPVQRVMPAAMMLAPAGETFHVKDCFFTRPKDRGITSIGKGCQDLQIDRCQFAVNEQPLPVRRTACRSCFNVNANDSKIRDNRFQRFRHTGDSARHRASDRRQPLVSGRRA